MKTLLEIIKENSEHVVSARWDEKDKYLNAFYKTEITKAYGIYIIIANSKIIKIGKASGKEGLRQRIKDYISKSYYNAKDRVKRDRTSQKIEKILSTIYVNEQIDIYTINLHEMAPIIEDPLLGGTIQLDPVRAYEQKFTKIAEKENHPLTLMKQKK